MELSSECIVNFNEFPSEIQLHILSFCSQDELLKVVPRVCKKWHQLAKDPSLWKKLVVGLCCDFKDGTCVFQRATQLKYLLFARQYYVYTIYNGFYNPDILEHLLTYKPPLEELDMRPHSRETIPEALMSSLVEAFPQMKCFRPIRYVRLSLKPIVIGWPMLTMLDLSSGRGISNSDYRNVLLQCKNLTGFGFGMDCITDGLMKVLIEGRQDKLRSLILYLYCCELTQVSYDLLGQCKELKKIKFENAKDVTDANLLALKSCGLENLFVSDSRYLPTYGWNTFFSFRDAVRNLCSLSIVMGGNIDDTTASILCQSHPRLQFLQLDNCWLITDLGIELIIETFSDLKTLYLQFLPLVTTMPLKKISSHLTDLQRLLFNKCGVKFCMPYEEANQERDRITKDYMQITMELKKIMPKFSICKDGISDFISD